MLPADTMSSYAVAIVTCGSWGAGRQMARRLARRGYVVVVVYMRDQDDAEEAVEEILALGGTAVAVRADITDDLDVHRLFDETEAAFGRVDLLVHGGSLGPYLAEELRARDVERRRPGE
jgi:3-oxoacyl-[acyl-carrier protein] reductase